MSILLEALRKSEKNQQSHKAPDIHTDDQTGSVATPLPMGPLALLLVVAFFASGWFVWQQYQAPAGAYQPPVTLSAENAPAVSNPAAAEKNGSQQMPSNPSPGASSSTPANPPAQTPPAQAPARRASAGQGRTPVESYQPLVSDSLLPEPGKPGSAKADQETAVTGASTDRQAGTRSPASGGSTEFTEEKGVTDQPAGGSVKQFHPGAPAPISYWDLPDAVREEVPEIKFSVLVYATDPADRFVLINGQRLGQGDSIQPGLEVREIRRDGVIFSYRLYQFLVER